MMSLRLKRLKMKQKRLSPENVKKDADSIRTCVLTGEQGTRDELLRLVLSPDNVVFADIEAKLPGRGLWIKLDRSVLQDGLKSGKLRRAVARGFSTAPGDIEISDDFEVQLEMILKKRLASALGLERRAGRVVLGSEKVRASALKGEIALLCVALDAAADGLAKVRSLKLPDEVPIIRLFNRDELGLALGRENVVQAAVIGDGVLGGLARWLDKVNRFYGLDQRQTGFVEDEKQEGKRAE